LHDGREARIIMDNTIMGKMRGPLVKGVGAFGIHIPG